MAMKPSCPNCGSELALRNGKYGKFWACPEYPECRYTVNFFEWVVEQLESIGRRLEVLEGTAEPEVKRGRKRRSNGAAQVSRALGQDDGDHDAPPWVDDLPPDEADPDYP